MICGPACSGVSQARQRLCFSENRKRRIDGRGYGAATDCQSNRLREFAERGPICHSNTIDDLVNSRRRPVRKSIQLVGHLDQHRQDLGVHVFAHGFFIENRRRPKEERTVDGHLAHRLGALDVQVMAGDAVATAVPYPQVSPDLTAGAWNRAGSANNRIEIRLR